MHQGEVHAGGLLDGVGHSIQTAVADSIAGNGGVAAVSHGNMGGNGGIRVLGKVCFRNIQRGLVVQVSALEHIQHFLDAQLFVLVVGYILYAVAKVFPHARRGIVAVILLQQEADAALTALAVDADDIGIVSAANVMRVNGNVRAGPLVQVVLLAPGHALGNGVLVAAAERSKHQGTGIRAALVHMHAGHAFIRFADGRHVAEVEVRVHAVAVHIHGQGDGIHVAGALAVAEQAAFNALGTGQNSQLGICHAAAAVVVGVGGQDHAVAVLEVLGAPFDLVGVNVRHAHFHRDRQIDDHRAVRGGLHHIQYGVANLNGVFRLGAGKAFGAVFKQEVALVFFAQLFNQLCAVNSDLLDLFLALFEHLLALGNAGGVIKVDDGARRTLNGLKCFTDDMVTALGQHLNGDIVRDAVAIDQGAQEVVLGLGRCREADLNLLKADPDEHIIKFKLFFQIHGNDQALVAIAQVYAAPGGSLFDMVFLGPFIDMAGLNRRGIITYMILCCVHHFLLPPSKFVCP